MHKIIFVGTAHVKKGFCNSEELYKILREIEPEVIFEEIRFSDFDYFYKSDGTVETNAVKKYRTYKATKQVPIDQYEVPENNIDNYKEKLNNIFEHVERASRECWLLKDEIDRNVYQFGFKYLNSSDHAKKWARICEIQNKAVTEAGDQNLIRALKMWRQQLQQRDAEMINNIYKYCSENIFNVGAFLVGASHKMSIAKEIENYVNKNPDLIHWNFAYDSKNH